MAKFKVGDKVWCVAQCYPGSPEGITGTPYRYFVKSIGKDKVSLEDFKHHVPTSYMAGGDNPWLDTVIHKNLFELVKKTYSSWILNNPVDKTIPTDASFKYIYSDKREEY